MERSDLLMGTVVEQRVYGGGPLHGRRIAAKTAREIDRLEKLWSVFRTDSEINLIGKAAGERPVKVHSDTLKVLRRAKELSRKCGGCFDITAAPLTELWSKASMEGVPPDEQAVKQRVALVDWNSLELDDRGYAYLPRKGQSLDLGGIGKGFAADRAREIYRRNGVSSGLINMSGNVMTIGGRKNGGPWRVGIRYHHILDPATGRSAAANVLGVSVIAASATDADAYATAVFVMGLKTGLHFLEQLPEAEGLIFDSSGQTHLTAGLQGIFFRLESY
ncbi:MAG: FAD:protein FMN transferase [Spirochaetia bacterium]